MYIADELAVHRARCELATQPYSLGGEGTIFPGSRPAGYHTLSEIVTKCLLTSSMLIKMQDHSLAIQTYGGFIDSLCLKGQRYINITRNAIGLKSGQKDCRKF